MYLLGQDILSLECQLAEVRSSLEKLVTSLSLVASPTQVSRLRDYLANCEMVTLLLLALARRMARLEVQEGEAGPRLVRARERMEDARQLAVLVERRRQDVLASVERGLGQQERKECEGLVARRAWLLLQLREGRDRRDLLLGRPEGQNI